MIGKQLGQYEIIAKIGEGGMGEVYRARDTRLGREAALKFLQPAFAADPERLARFRTEAKVLAALNHPNIAAIHGLEEADGINFLAMEYVEGMDLTARLDASPLPLDEALELAHQLTEGLEAAHERGIIHRDLKPSNLRITPEGQLKILDFGLARVDDPLDSGDILNSPTMSMAYTREGVIMGTAAYMSPEQARGRKADQRSDIWTFGAILYEMLTGQRLFTGETVSDTVAAVLRADLDFEQLPPGTPEGVRRLLERCLERDARSRLRDIGEARVRLERWRDDPDSIHESFVSSSLAVPVERRTAIIPWVITAVAICVALLVVGLSRRQASPPTLHTEWALEVPGEAELPATRINVLLSPDGRWCGWITNEGIRLRRVDSQQITLLPETLNTEAACFSPDSHWLAFVARGAIYRVNVAGGAPFRLGESPLTRGLAWVDEKTLVLTDGIATGLLALDLDSMKSRVLTRPDSTRGERSHRWPTTVPGKRGVLFECQFLGRDYDSSDIDYLDLDTGERHTVMHGGAMPMARAAGHLLFVRGEVIYAMALDLERMATSGLPTAAREGIMARVGNQEDDDGSAQFALNQRGDLFYLDRMGSGNEQSRLAEIDFADGALKPLTDLGYYGAGQISPDGRSLAVAVFRDGDWDILVRDLATGNEQMLTSRPSVEYMGTWSADSRQFYWAQSSVNGGRFEVWTRPADGSLPASFVNAPTGLGGVFPSSASADGKYLSATINAGVDRYDIVSIDLSADPPQSAVLVGGPGSELSLGFHSGGHFFGYSEGAVYLREGETVGGKLLLRRFPDSGAVWSLPTPGRGLIDWRWAPPAGGIVACFNEGVFLLPVELGSETPVIGTARQLLDLRAMPEARHIRSWYLKPDGTGALVSLAEDLPDDGPVPSLVLVTGWDDVVQQKLREAGD